MVDCSLGRGLLYFSQFVCFLVVVMPEHFHLNTPETLYTLSSVFFQKRKKEYIRCSNSVVDGTYLSRFCRSNRSRISPCSYYVSSIYCILISDIHCVHYSDFGALFVQVFVVLNTWPTQLWPFLFGPPPPQSTWPNLVGSLSCWTCSIMGSIIECGVLSESSRIRFLTGEYITVLSF